MAADEPELVDELMELRADNASLRSALAVVDSSKFWQLRNRWFEIKQRLGLNRTGPLDLGRLLGSRANAALSTDTYQFWLMETRLRPTDINRMRDTIAILPQCPKFSIIMPVYNTRERYLREAIESVLNQVYPNWELCIADDASTKPYVREVLLGYAERDQRIRLTLRDENGHISAASNSALALATGDYVGLLDHDDVLTPDALYENAMLLVRFPDTDMVYSDEDKIGDDGVRIDPYFKPDWAPDTFLSRMYYVSLRRISPLPR